MIARLLWVALLVPALLQAQEPTPTVEAAHRAAAEGRHADAIELYERAIDADPSLEQALRPRLALQYLWAGRPVRAAALLERQLALDPADCDARQHYALALSWSGRLREALQEYRRAQDLCPQLRTEARMGEARVLLWRNRVREAEAVYAAVLASGTPEERVQARIGLANAALATYEPRRALRMFRALHDEGVRSPGVLEGLARAAQESGLRAEARAVLDEAESAGVRSGALDRVREEIRLATTPALRLAPAGFSDADGTERQRVEGVVEHGLGRGPELEAAVARSRLSGPETIDAWHARAAVAHRPTVDLAVSGSIGVHEFASGAFRPVTGELGIAWMPTDLRRVDVSAARLVVLDNVAAIREGLSGDFVGVGIREGITRWTGASAALDVTRWSPGNIRTRVQVGMDHRFSGAPMVTVGWPTLYQRYSDPFDFHFFSPTSYWETGPDIDVYHRVRRVWHLNGYLRGGAQREAGRAWSPLGMARLSIERELRRAWGVRVDLSWSNSNLSTSTGFERAAAEIAIARRLAP